MRMPIVFLTVALFASAMSIRIMEGVTNGDKGVDVCSYDGNINWVKVKAAGYKFAILRTTVKNGTMDSTFEANYKNAKAAGLEVSGYHFSYSLSTSEAKTAANNLNTKLNGKKLPIYIDLEWSTQGEKSKQTVTDIAKAFINQMKSHGYSTHVYSNVDWYKNHYYPDQLKSLGCKFWLAAYGPDDGTMHENYRPNLGEIIWQYTSKGKVSGIPTTEVDLDVKS